MTNPFSDIQNCEVIHQEPKPILVETPIVKVIKKQKRKPTGISIFINLN